jgi:hydroxyacylglutathione hydrolase
VKEVAPGVHRLAGLPPAAINVYLIDDPSAGDGAVLIDAASRHATRRILRQVIDRPLSMLALTHVHPDHQGAARAVCEARGIPLACYVDGVDAMEGREPIQDEGHAINRFIKWAFEGPPHPVRRPFAEGDTIGGFNVIHAPGHSPSEVILFRESDRVAICGDVINTIDLRTGIPRVQEPPAAFSDDPMLNRGSIRKLLDLRPSVILPGHGWPLRDLGKLERLVAGFGA